MTGLIHLMHYFKLAFYCVVFISYFPASAGSYEDFFQAIKRDDARTVSTLLARGFDPNTPSPDGQFGLHLAIMEPSPAVSQALVGSRQIQINRRNASGETPLMLAALKGNLDLAKVLIAMDADINHPGWTPLHYASSGGHVAVVAWLLERYAYIDAASPNGTTPLMMAAGYGSAGTVKFLLEAGADASLRNQQGMTAADFAQRFNRPDAMAMLQPKALTASPADVPANVPRTGPQIAPQIAPQPTPQAAPSTLPRVVRSAPTPAPGVTPAPSVTPRTGQPSGW